MCLKEVLGTEVYVSCKLQADTILVYKARIEGLLTRSSEMSPFISSNLKVDSQFSNCSGGPGHKQKQKQKHQEHV